MLVIRDIIHKLFVRISNREDSDLISVCNVCLGLFVHNLRISTLLNIVSICIIHIHKLIFIPIYLLLWGCSYYFISCHMLLLFDLFIWNTIFTLNIWIGRPGQTE